MNLREKEILATKMIQHNPDVTIGHFWEFIKYTPELEVISSEDPVVIPQSYHPKKPLKDPCPFKRPLAKYDNRSQEDIYNQYAPIR